MKISSVFVAVATAFSFVSTAADEIPDAAVQFMAETPTSVSVPGKCGVCVRMSTASGRGFQYYARIPNARQYQKPNDIIAGKLFKDSLRDCRANKFFFIFDEEGNAHVDFALKSRKWHGGLNNCDVGKFFTKATGGKCPVTCVEGDPSRLAAEWASRDKSYSP